MRARFTVAGLIERRRARLVRSIANVERALWRERRTVPADRPLLADDGTVPFAELLNERLGAYEDAAHHLVDTTSLTPVEVVDKIDEVL